MTVTEGVQAAGGVSAETITLGRIELNRGRLREARAAADRFAHEIPAFGAATRAGLNTALSRTEASLTELATRISLHGANETRLAKLERLTAATDRVVRECFALASGVLSRTAGLDNGACHEADVFVAELAALVDSSLARPTVPGEGEFVHRGVDVIRRRVPDDGVWDLAVMAHEFGHLVVAHQLWDPINDQKLGIGSDVLTGWCSYSQTQGEELFCDVFATFVLGPAYAATIILHRLDPTADAGRASTHPPDAARAVVVLETLRQLARVEPPGTRIGIMHGQLAAAWAALRGTTPSAVDVSADDTVALERQARNAAGLLARDFESMRYRWPNTLIQRVVTYLRTGQMPDSGDLDTTVRDILNAAWLIRFEAWRTNSEVVGGLSGRAKTAILRVEKGDDSNAG